MFNYLFNRLFVSVLSYLKKYSQLMKKLFFVIMIFNFLLLFHCSDSFPYKDGQKIVENGVELRLSVSIKEESKELQRKNFKKEKQGYLEKESIHYYSVTAFSNNKKFWQKKYIKKLQKKKIGDGAFKITFDSGAKLKEYLKFSKNDDSIFSKIAITSQPKPSSIFEGQSFQLSASVSKEGKTGTVTYQWLKNGQVVSSGLNYSVPSAAQSDEGVYQFKVKSAEASLESIKIGVIVVKKPIITLNKDANGNPNPFDIKKIIDDRSIKKITKYKWIDAGGGKFDLEVHLELQLEGEQDSFIVPYIHFR